MSRDAGLPPTLWVVTKDDALFQAVDRIIQELRVGKLEFDLVKVIKVEPWLSLAASRKLSSPAAVISERAGTETLVDYLKQVDPAPPLLVLVDEYAVEPIDEIYSTGYLQLQGFFRKRSLGDAEERGVLARMLKEALRQDPRIASQVQAKPLGWKIRVVSAGGAARRQVSLVLDRRMRHFTQQLAFVTDRVRTEIPKVDGDGQALINQYFDLGTTFRTGTSSSRQVQDLKSKWKKHFAPPTAERPRPILLEGESGTGKTLAADWIARRLTGESPVQVSLVNMSAELLEAELFGTVSGGFTDSVSRPGKLHLARGKAVFLDEIGDAPPEIQAKLLVYLDHFCFRPVGWPFPEALYSPAYVIAGTNRNLQQMIVDGRFREDLYFRFLHRLRLPPLRERLSDLRILVDFVLQDQSINGLLGSGREVESVTVATLEKLERHPFPGNFRELEDVLARAVFNAVRAGRKTLLPEDVEFLR